MSTPSLRSKIYSSNICNAIYPKGSLVCLDKIQDCECQLRNVLETWNGISANMLWTLPRLARHGAWTTRGPCQYGKGLTEGVFSKRKAPGGQTDMPPNCQTARPSEQQTSPKPRKSRLSRLTCNYPSNRSIDFCDLLFKYSAHVLYRKMCVLNKCVVHAADYAARRVQFILRPEVLSNTWCT